MDDPAPVLRRGMSGAAVKIVQQCLINAGYLTPMFGATGEFGALTESALKFFQQSRGLEGSGIVEGETWARLRAVN